MPDRIRVAAVDDHALLLRGLEAHLAAPDCADLDLVAVAGTVDELLADGPELDVVLLDLHLQDDSDPAANTARLVAAGAAVLLFTSEHRPAVIHRALAAGAGGLVLKEETAGQVVDAVRRAAAGEFVLSSSLALDIVEEPAGAIPLSTRERQVLTLLARGLPWDAVARKLGIKTETARTHVRRVTDKYAERGVQVPNGPRELLYRAISDGHVDLDEPVG